MKKIVSMLLLLALLLTLAPLPTLAQDIACENEVVVQASDFLSTIADKYYANILAYPAIVEATNAQGGDFATIDNPDAIEPGWKLCVPSAEDAQTMLGQEFSAPAAAAAPAAGEKIELRIAWWGSQKRHDDTIKVIEMYEAENPNVDITYEFASFNDYWTKLAPQAAGGNLPDIMQQDYARIEEWVANDWLMPLDGFVESGAIDLSDVPAGSINGGRIGGALYGLNLGNNSQAFILDTDAFAKAGLELPAQNWTWQEFEQTVLALHEKTGIWGMGPGLDNEQIWKSLYLGHGEWSYSNDGNQIGYTDDQIYADYLHMLLELQEAGAIPSREEVVARFTGVGPENDPIVTQESAIASYWSNQIVAIQSAAGENRNFYLAHLPRPEGGQPSNYLKPSMFFSITKHAKHPEEAAKFINYFTNNLEANKVLMAERGVPISPKIQESLKPLLGKSQTAMFDFLARVEADSSPIRPADPAAHADLIDNIYWPEVIDPVLFGLITPEEGVATLRKLGGELLAQQE
jgi:multiple sugar transport system substrate-binding protein